MLWQRGAFGITCARFNAVIQYFRITAADDILPLRAPGLVGESLPSETNEVQDALRMPLPQIDQASQCRFLLDAPSYKAFDAALKSSPAAKNKRLEKLLKRPSRWTLM